MAGDWIKMRSNLWDDPRVSGLADATKTKEATIIGGLYWLWATADQHTEDGFMPCMSLKTIDRKTGISGFGKALEDIGWISESNGGIVIERFEEHNGASAKERAQTAKRVANHKSKGNAKVTHAPLLKEEKSNANTVTSALPREEKRREESTSISEHSVSDNGNSVDRTPQASTRKGLVCGLLRKAGMADAAPHYLTDEDWERILSKRTDEEIVELAKAKMAARPGQRTGLKYIAPALLADPQSVETTPNGAKKAAPWWSSDATILAKGREVGLDPRAGEDWQQFRGRINEKISQQEAQA